jgi:DNA ligase (NAD+)
MNIKVDIKTYYLRNPCILYNSNMSADTEKKPTKVKNINETIKSIQKDYKKNGNTLKVDELVKVLKKLSDTYYNTGESLVEDNVYDYLRDLLEEKDPENSYLLEVGAPVRGTKEKVKLPFEMGSLTKIKPETDDIEKWTKEYKGPYVMSDKLDGASAQLYKDFSGNAFLYSRGDLVYGQNISHLIKYFFDDQTIDNLPKGICIRGELIISKEKFKNISSYMKNARNAVSGLVNSKTVDQKVAKATNFVAYAILSPRYEQSRQMELLEELGLNTVVYKEVKKLNNDLLKKYLLERREKSLYEMDGIVCIDDSKIYEHKGGYPKHAFAFKMLLEDQTAITTVVKVLWEPSMDGYLKPRIKVKPVDLVGTTITYATAHNAKYIVDNNIGPDAKVKIVRSGDVIPYIMEVVEQADEPQMPDYPYKWNSTKVDLVLKTMEGVGKRIVTIKLITYFFQKIEVKNFGEGIVTKLVDEGYDSIKKILSADKNELSSIEGLGEKSITKIFDEIDRAFEEVDLVTFMAASHKFGRGLGERKIREIVNMYPNILHEKWKKDKMIGKILEVSGFSDKLAELFSENFENFLKFYDEISKIKDISRFEELVNSSDEDEEKMFANKTIVFTGFRDPELKKQIIKNGGKVSDSVSSKTYILICADSTDQSTSKFKKAESTGTKIMTKTEFLKKYKTLN